ncbi:ABC transporter substrate-binding protein [Paracidovorax cattleyae]|uniref:Peptide/nickel transport system substrate-binding protein n=1 Tax=Paracidovorax cattleyae TaxID=80868 RepID=A0A1H0VS70_9BURK|nr:ABC transporter substrate-binding protein [Paracidovorax cattleyae]AVS74497.1 ABC transporter substrate-binding protein [Paracidovorax cattleyae]MBF9264245.1 ABC transporter substrate-binding protein [Paracidovorax cattleyae]SDP81290.1 peptide/nickel transport system substrate-binding protein [Paracidovorax cattleyae]
MNLTRRTLIAATAGTLGGLSAGCRPGKAGTATATTGGTAPQARGARPDITIAVEALWRNIAPVSGISNPSIRIFPNVYDRLIEVDYLRDPSGRTLAPRLATTWTRQDRTWTLTLREDVLFHDGSPMTAEDVAFTLSAERLWGAHAYEPRGRTYAAGFVDVRAVGRYTVQVTTREPDIHLPGKLAGYIGYVVPRADYLRRGVDAFGQAPIGTGSYRVRAYKSSEGAVLEAFDRHWSGPPPAQSLHFRLVPEYAGRLAGLATGEFDFITSIPTDAENQVRALADTTLLARQINNYPAVAFNCRPDPADNPLVDVRLRRALACSVDMPAIARSLFHGETFFPDPPFNFPEYGDFYDPKARGMNPYDPQAARRLIAQTAYRGEPLIWHVTRNFWPNYDAAAEIMAAMWQDAGLNVQVQFLDNFQLSYKRPFHLLSISGGTSFIPGDPYQPLWLDWGPDGLHSTAAWRLWEPPRDFVERGRAYAAAVALADRQREARALARRWEQEMPGLYLWRSVASWAHAGRFRWTPVPEFEMRLYGGYLHT